MDDVRAVLAGERRWAVVHGEMRHVIQTLPPDVLDLVTIDAPYSSGGAFRGDRAQSTDAKYTTTESQGRREDFEGDVRDQLSWVAWCSFWLSEVLHPLKGGGSVLSFCDWRQIAAMVTAVQAAGLVFRGVGVWDKTEGSRPRLGAMRNQCEFIVWATKGPHVPYDGAPCLPGCFRYVVRQDDKHHQTGKPTPLMADLATMAPPNGVILDGCAGSGTTLVGALLKGRRAIGCELVPEYYDIARRRCEAAEAGTEWRAPAEQASLFGGRP